MKWLPSVIFFIFGIQVCSLGQESIVVDTTTFTVEELVRDVLIQSECAEITNVQFTGMASQIGYFSKGDDAIGVADGIIISTGRVHDAVGPNQSSGTETRFIDVAHVGDDDLRRVANVGVNNMLDDAIIEFDFIPLEDHLEFEFVFASEEYCEFAGGASLFNDVFGFFLSGPGITGPYSNNGKNIAVLPGTNNNITVFNINHNVNYDYFIDNTPINQPQALPEHIETCKLVTPRDGINSILEAQGKSVATIEYDGFTVTIKAESDVIPFQQYHLRIGVGDVNDGSWDSAVFLKAGSFKAGQPTALIATPDTLDCNTSTVTIDASLSSTGKKFSYNWSTDDGNIVSGAFGFTPIIDEAGTYQLIVSRSGTDCSDTAIVEVIFNGEQPEIIGANSGVLTCSEPVVEIDIDISQPSSFTYQVEYPTSTTSPIQNDTKFTTSHAGWHRLVAFSANGCQDEFMHFVDIDTFAGIVELPTLSFTCRDEELVIDPQFEGLGFSFDFLWQTTDGLILSNNTSNTVTVGQAGNYSFESTNENNGCTRAYNIGVVSDEVAPIIDAGDDAKLDCIGGRNTANGSIDNALGNEIIDWYSLEGAAVLPGADPLHPQFASPGHYVLSVVRENGCFALDTVHIAAADDAPIISLLHADTITCDVNSGIIDITITGEHETVLWDTDDGEIENVSANSLSIFINGEGVYQVETTNASGCSSEFFIEVLKSEPPYAFAGEDRSLDCDGATLLEADGAVVENGFEYTWSGGPDPLFETDQATALVADPGLYRLVVFDPSTGCISTDEVEIFPGIPDVSFALNFSDCNFESGSFMVDNSDQSLIANIIYGENYFAPSDHIDVKGINEITLVKSNGCEQIVELNYILNEELQIVFDTPEEVVAGQAFDLTAEINRFDREIASVQWISAADVTCPDCLLQTLALHAPTLFELLITDIYGCTNSATILITPTISVKTYVPNAFSPNDDGINDVLEIFGNEYVSSIESFSIYNRWGERIFSLLNDMNNQIGMDQFVWDGTSGNGKQAPEGIYVYKAIIRTTADVSSVLSGDFVLIR